jgi:peptidoglycan-N-acetylglucosamine deacetylase
MGMFGKMAAVLVAFMLAGCASVPPQADAAPTNVRRIALTFDDAPRILGPWLSAEERTSRLIASLRSVRAPQAAFFVNPGNLEQPFGAGGEARLSRYVAAGHVLANHSQNHRSLTQLDAEAYLAEIDRAEAWLRGRPGYRPWFRFPYLNEGQRDLARRDAVFAGLAARGIRHGYVTVDASDWQMEQMAIDAVQRGDAIDRDALRDLYVGNHVAAARVYDRVMVQAIGRSPVHVMLLHETDMAAYYVDDLIRALRADGWQIVSADAAFADPLGELAPPRVAVGQGLLTHQLASTSGVPRPFHYDGIEPGVLTAAFNERVLHRPATVAAP